MKALLTFKKGFVLLIILSFAQLIKAQNIPMTNTTIQACSGVFMDPGGTSNYPNGATITMTIEPLISGDGVCLDFTSFIVDYSTFGFSELSFYDGFSTSDPLIMTATGDWLVNVSGTAFDFTGPGMVCANGPLTIQWNPDDSDIGWEANISCFTPLPSTSGCSITADGTTASTTDTVLYINAGDQVDLAALGTVVDVPLSNNFNTGTIGTGWNSTVTADFTNPACVGASSDGTTFLWMGTVSAPRTLSSQTYDVSNGGVISFDIKFATQAGGNPCEGPDLVDEGVYLQYSIDSGVSWSTLHYFFPSHYTDGSTHLQDWNNYVFNVPTVAQTTTTSFRWTQQDISSPTTDHWGLDNVVISIANPSTISWDQGLGAGNNHTVNPTVDTVYTATVTDAFGNTCNTPVQVFINTPSTTIDFDGNNDYINRASLLSGESATSMMSWIKLDSGFDGGDIMGEGNYRLYIDGSNQLKSSIGTTSVGSSVNYTINMFDSYSDGWNTSNDGYVAIFVGGVQIGTDFEPANGVSPDTANFTVNVGDVVDIVFRSDNYPGEMSFNIDNTSDGGVRVFPASGNQGHSSGSGTIDNFSFTAACSSCPASTSSLTTPNANAPILTTDLWYHVATIYDGSTGEVKNYLNGELQWTGTGVGVSIETSSDDFEIGRRSDTKDNYFEGAIYESRVYDVSLTETQLREQIYQGVQSNGGTVHGSVIPKDIDGGSLSWANLVSYYKMDTVVSSGTSDSSISGALGSLNNMTTNQERTAPLPYVATASGTWSTPGTWQFGSVWDITSLPNKDWAIVQITNNSKVTTTTTHTHLGLLVDTGSELEIQNNQLLQNTSYLKLDGQIDLVDESQLIQTVNSDLEITSAGYLERDQQGKSDIYSYNYWSSPVGAINTSTNNTSFSVSSVLRDGTNANNPLPITYVTTYNGAPTTPVTLSNYWFWKFDNVVDNYSNWQYLSQTGVLDVGLGYTMKGTGAGGTVNAQNYTFIGKPNNGTIYHTLSIGNSSLLGNPYPSALDANQFILDNIDVINEAGDANNTSVFTGAIYFWEHFSTNNSHVLAAYQGGYATYNLSGAVMAIPDQMVSSNGTGSVLPKRYIPVGQGFFVEAGEGGVVEFNNDQRVFKRESDGESDFIRSSVAPSTVSDPDVAINRMYFRAALPGGAQRQLLLAVKQGATLGVNYGYDAKMIDSNSTDITWSILEDSYVIQTIGELTENLEIPLLINTTSSGTSEFSIEDLQGIDPAIEIYFLDKRTNTYTDIRVSSASFELTAGEDSSDRYFVVFKAIPAITEDIEDVEDIIDDIRVYHANGSVIIKNKTDIDVSNIKLYNVAGQRVLYDQKSYTNTNRIHLPVSLSTGIYLVQFEYNNNQIMTKKILIN